MIKTTSTKYMNICHPYCHSVPSVLPLPEVMRCESHKSLPTNHWIDFMSVLKILWLSFLIGHWTGKLMVHPLSWTAQYAEATAHKEDREGVREVIVANQPSWLEAFGEMKQYSASTIGFWSFLFYVCWIKGVKELSQPLLHLRLFIFKISCEFIITKMMLSHTCSLYILFIVTKLSVMTRL